jgi:two-component system cell cycle sensor histidine kinase/response regulator CckA
MERDDSLLEFSALATVLLAHDLQNLLAIMAGCVDSLASRTLGVTRADRDVAELNEAINSAFRLSRDLLSTVGLHHRQETPVIDVHELIERYRSTVQRLLGEHVRLVVRFDAATSIVEATPVQIEWILLNLAANGRDAMPEGGTLVIETSSIEWWLGRQDAPVRGGRYLRLTVRDEGTGVSDEARARMFEPFFGTRGFGSGLGLTSVAATVRMLRGWLYVDSADQQGTSVRVLLPIFVGGADRSRPSPERAN